MTTMTIAKAINEGLPDALRGGRTVLSSKGGVDLAQPAAYRPIASEAASFTDVPLSQLRKTIAKRLAQSIGPVPTFYLTSEIDMERVWEAREALNAGSAADRSEAGKARLRILR